MTLWPTATPTDHADRAHGPRGANLEPCASNHGTSIATTQSWRRTIGVACL
jgi:hypothetical protein